MADNLHTKPGDTWSAWDEQQLRCHVQHLPTRVAAWRWVENCRIPRPDPLHDRHLPDGVLTMTHEPGTLDELRTYVARLAAAAHYQGPVLGVRPGPTPEGERILRLIDDQAPPRTECAAGTYTDPHALPVADQPLD